jgi:hypothetical protein
MGCEIESRQGIGGSFKRKEITFYFDVFCKRKSIADGAKGQTTLETILRTSYETEFVSERCVGG